MQQSHDCQAEESSIDALWKRFIRERSPWGGGVSWRQFVKLNLKPSSLEQVNQANGG